MYSISILVYYIADQPRADESYDEECVEIWSDVVSTTSPPVHHTHHHHTLHFYQFCQTQPREDLTIMVSYYGGSYQ